MPARGGGLALPRNETLTLTPAQADGAPFAPGSVDVVISCLASRTGTKSDSYAIDLEATKNCMEAAQAAEPAIHLNTQRQKSS